MTTAKTIAASPPRRRAPRYLVEAHGVRGIALGLVVAFHLFGQGRVSGGVDVFLVISAYLLTGSLDRALGDGRFSLSERYARTFSRLLPTALLVLVTVGVVGLLVLPRSRWEQLLREVGATALLFQNVELADSGLAYGAAGSGASPLQHYWSLSVQGQFLLLWPLLALAVAGVLALLGRRWSTSVFMAVAAGMTLASFCYAIWLVGVDQPLAYYSLPARVWELGAGGLAALVLARRHVPPRIGGALAWVGLALIVSCGFVIDGARLFPGVWTLWPVLGTLAVLAGSESGGTDAVGLTRLLQLRPLTALADIAYPLYLWHWPVLVLYLAWRQRDELGPFGAAGILALSLALAWGTQRYFTDPLTRRARRAIGTRRGTRRVLVSLVTASVVIGGLGFGAAAVEQSRAAAALATESDAAAHPGAEFLRLPGAPSSWTEPPVPSPDVAQQDVPDIYDRGCVQNWRDGPGLDEVLVCEDEPGTRTVVLSGGSHAVQYYPAIRAVADEAGWRLVVVDKDGCRLAADDPRMQRSPSCTAWNANAVETILSLEPDAIITVGTETRSEEGEAGEERVHDGQVAVWQELSDAGVPVIALRDSPRFPHRVPECLETAADPGSCGMARGDAYAATFPLLDRELPAGVVPIDLADGFCTPERCEAVVGNVVAYRDQSHITATYARTLTPLLSERLRGAVPALMGGG